MDWHCSWGWHIAQGSYGVLWETAVVAAGKFWMVLVEVYARLLQEWLLFPIPGSKALSIYPRAEQNNTYLEMLKSMSTVCMSIPLLLKSQACCPPVYLKKARQIDGSTALTSLNMAPALAPVPSTLNSPFLRTKMHLPRSCVASLEWDNLGKTKYENFPVERCIIM